jgi:hypothetical protein
MPSDASSPAAGPGTSPEEALSRAVQCLRQVARDHPLCLACHCYRDTAAECLRLAADRLGPAALRPVDELHELLAGSEGEHG